MHPVTRNRIVPFRTGIRTPQSGIVSLMLVLMLSAALSSIVFGLMELGVPYMRLKKDAELRDRAFKAAGYCRDLAIAHVHENMDFDIVFAEAFVSSLFADVSVPAEVFESVNEGLGIAGSTPWKKPLKYRCSIESISKAKLGSEAPFSYFIEVSAWNSEASEGSSSEEVAVETEGRRYTRTEISFDGHMNILSDNTVEIQK